MYSEFGIDWAHEGGMGADPLTSPYLELMMQKLSLKRSRSLRNSGSS